LSDIGLRSSSAGRFVGSFNAAIMDDSIDMIAFAFIVLFHRINSAARLALLLTLAMSLSVFCLP